MPDVCASSMRSVIAACGRLLHSGTTRDSGSSSSSTSRGYRLQGERGDEELRQRGKIEERVGVDAHARARRRASRRTRARRSSRPRCSMRATAPVNSAPHGSAQNAIDAIRLDSTQPRAHRWRCATRRQLPAGDAAAEDDVGEAADRSRSSPYAATMTQRSERVPTSNGSSKETTSASGIACSMPRIASACCG